MKVVQVCSFDGSALTDCQYVSVNDLISYSSMSLEEMIPIFWAICSLMAIVWVSRVVFKLLSGV